LTDSSVAGTALEDARDRIAARPASNRIARHLEAAYGIAVAGLSEFDLGVYRVERADGPAWVARVFPPARPQDAAAGDAEILRFLARHDFQSERGVTDEPLSAFDGHAVLVTEFVPGAPRSERAAAISENGGLDGYWRLGSLEPEEIDRIPALMPVRAAALAAWSCCMGRTGAEQAAKVAADARAVADAVGPRAVSFLRSGTS
jgi:Ser/Thr protein kinase RdoA (MazF antagonist)